MLLSLWKNIKLMKYNIQELVTRIASKLGYTFEEFVAYRGSRELSRYRNMTFYILHVDYNFSISQIARFFNRCERTIQYSNAAIKCRLQMVKEEMDLYNMFK